MNVSDPWLPTGCEKVYRDQALHSGVILLRLADQSGRAKIAAMERLLAAYSGRIEGLFAVVTEQHVRFGRSPRLIADP